MTIIHALIPNLAKNCWTLRVISLGCCLVIRVCACSYSRYGVKAEIKNMDKFFCINTCKMYPNFPPAAIIENLYFQLYDNTEARNNIY